MPAGATTGPVQVVSTLQQGSTTNHTFTVLPPAPPPEDVQYYHLDHLGSVRMITDSAAQVVARYDYTPYGQPFPGDLDAESSRFAQMERTPETGNQSAWEPLAYAGARYYHSQTGRFISADDPIYGDPFDPQSMNLYAYARNNPLGFIDPLGRAACPEHMDSNDCLDRGTFYFIWESLLRSLVAPETPTEFAVSMGVQVGVGVIISVATGGTGAPAASATIGRTAATYAARGAGQLRGVAASPRARVLATNRAAGAAAEREAARQLVSEGSTSWAVKYQ